MIRATSARTRLSYVERVAAARLRVDPILRPTIDNDKSSWLSSVAVWDFAGHGPAGIRPISLQHHQKFPTQLGYQRRFSALFGCAHQRLGLHGRLTIALWQSGQPMDL